MSHVALDSRRSVLVIVDIQANFMAAIDQSDRVLERSLFLAKVAHLLEIPVLATEQYPSRMGETAPELLPFVENRVSKMSFSCMGEEAFAGALRATGRDQVVLVGIETHICVAQTAQDLFLADWEVVVCPDALSARTNDRHKLGMERIRDLGVVPAHTEAVAYEWMKRADDPRFREFLQIVKSANF